jgi:AraC family transcriptional regulator of adaptative response / DNA-3-methyladenine glycosylase II
LSVLDTFAFFRLRQIPAVEVVTEASYGRTVRAGESTGTISVSADLQLELSASLEAHRSFIEARVRRMFDVDADWAAIERVLGADPKLAPRLAKHPRLRVPGCWDAFELSVRAVLGQQVSVAAARTFAGRLARVAGQAIETAHPELSLVFPNAAAVAAADLSGVGLVRTRIATLKALAAGAEKAPGIGPWTREYIAMRSGNPDAFPASDLVLRKSIGLTEKELLKRAERWRPFRAYAAILLWRTSKQD